LFDFGDPEEVIRIGFQVFIEVCVPGDSIEARAFDRRNSGWLAPPPPLRSNPHNHVGHADDGGRVHASAEFGEYGTVRAKAALYRSTKDRAEVLLVLSVRAVADAVVRIEVPISGNGVYCAVPTEP